MLARNFLPIALLFSILLIGFGLLLERFLQNIPTTVEFSVKNFFNTELGKINATYIPPLDQYKACEIAKQAASQTSLQAFRCTGYNKQNENWQIVYQPSPANIYVFAINEKERIVVISVGQAE